MLFAYLGPETLLPMTSVLAAAVGVVAMFGRNLFHVIKMGFGVLTGKSRRAPKLEGTTRPAHSRLDGPQRDLPGQSLRTTARAVEAHNQQERAGA